MPPCPCSHLDHPEMLEQRPVQEGKETWYIANPESDHLDPCFSHMLDLAGCLEMKSVMGARFPQLNQ